MYITSSEDEEAVKKSIEILGPIDTSKAEEILKEIKQVMDNLGIEFFLRKGTCLAAIRDNSLIPWDDDIDIGSVIGHNGITEESADQVIESLKKRGFAVQVDRLDYAISVVSLKSSIRTDWMLLRIIDGNTFHWPGVRIPAGLFVQPEEIDFLGEKFLVPEPVEDYLTYMYGKEWRVPKKAGQYERDVLEQIPSDSLLGYTGKIKRFVTRNLIPWRAARIRVLNSNGSPIPEADVTIAGIGHSRTDRKGYAKFFIPYSYIYSLVIRFNNHEEVLYEENLGPRGAYTYKADTNKNAGRNFVLAQDN